ncbi:hypothetical protein A4G19_06425 [Pasteurellaceae bacterium Macca]|nr:hypothetical protein [Pasteurellaceae bacterium Macca]
MNKIYIEHNPFTIDTNFFVNDILVETGEFFEANKNLRLQLWIENLFPALYNLLGSQHFEITFKGVEADIIDMEESVKDACKNGFSITLHTEQVKDSAERLEDIQQLMIEAKEHPLFKENLNNARSTIHHDFKEAFNKDFDVYVAATMSAGKSTLINAMLGTDLLPAANEATTATIAQITDNDSMPDGYFEGSRFNKAGVEVDSRQIVNSKKLKTWNIAPDTKFIKLTGNIIGIKERENVRLVITDTPGPNNSQDEEHSRTTMGYIQDSKRNPLILYILNATQLGTNDDKTVLNKIAEIMQEGGKQSKDRFIFIVNKMDEFDPEKENIPDVLKRIRKYLISNGIESPLVYPVSALLTHLLRKRIVNDKNKVTEEQELTQKEIGQLNGMESVFSNSAMDLVQYMPLTRTALHNLKTKGLSTLAERSGLPAIEAMIDEYIDKYNLPNRVNRAYNALKEAIQISSNENQITADLENNLNQLDDIQQQLELLIHRKDLSNDAKAKIEILIQDKKSLYSRETMEKIDDLESNIRTKVANFQDIFVTENEEISPLRAKRLLERLENDISFESRLTINELEKVIESSQEITQQKLHSIFQQYIDDLLDGLNSIPQPILEGLQAQISSIATITSLGLNEDEIETKTVTEEVYVGKEAYEVKIGERSVSKWYNPFTWGDTEDITETRYRNKYETHIKEVEVINLQDIWLSREAKISHHFNELIRFAKFKIEENVEKDANTFMNFMSAEFNIAFEKIINDLNTKIANKDILEKEINKAKEALTQIDDFKNRLNNIIAL